MTSTNASPNWKLKFEKKAEKAFQKARKKSPQRVLKAYKKLKEVTKNPYRYKPLRGDLHGHYRVHVNSSFVILYRVDKEQRAVVVVALEHHDSAYKK